MRKVILFSIFATTINFMISCGVSAESNPVAEQKAQVEMKVDGMVCAMGCAKYIQDKVADLDGVLSSEVNFEEGVAHFEFDENKINAAELESFIDGIHDGQYDAEILEAKKGNSAAEPIEEETVSEEEQEEIATVSERFQITFPDLLGYFLHSLR